MEKERTLKGQSQYRQGLISSLSCGILWGIIPIYWQWLKPIPSSVIIFYRIALVAAVCLIASLILYDKSVILSALKDRRTMAKYIAAGILITANWSIYIWAVNAGFVIQTCIGYYIEPVAVCLLGIVLFRDKLNKYKIAAFATVAVGVAAVIWYFREIPMIALSLALTFSIYAALKKNLTAPPVLSLLYETIFLLPAALAVIVWIETTGRGAIDTGQPYQYGLLMLSGPVTALPLALFANAAHKLNLFVLGLLEYIAPTISLILGIYLFREPFEPVQLIAFGIIWSGILIFSIGEYKEMKKSQERK